MRALEPEVFDAVWGAVRALLPAASRFHPLGCHRPRICDEVCFRGLMIRLVTGASWVDVEAIMTSRCQTPRFGPAATSGSRPECSMNSARRPQPPLTASWASTWRRSRSTDRFTKRPAGARAQDPIHGPRQDWLEMVGRVRAPRRADRLGHQRSQPQRHPPAGTHPRRRRCRRAPRRHRTLHLDRGYDYPVVRSRLAALGIDDVDIQRRGTKQQGTNKPITLGLRWIVESTNSWLSNYGQLRRSTDPPKRPPPRRSMPRHHRAHRRQLLTYRDRWSPK